MPFTDAQLTRIRHELGQNVLQVGADIYVGVHQILEVVIQNHIAAEITTTSGTSVTAATPGTPVAITLASATGFAAGERIHVDVDGRFEIVTVQSLAGAVATAQFMRPHSGTYPVSMDGPIPIAKSILNKIDAVKQELASVRGEGAVKQVDELRFFQAGQGGSSLFGELGGQLQFWRKELASALGIPNLWDRKGQSGGRLVAY